ncbi:MAG: hypothetical protein GY786_03985 [Proteobacteria bacterium]|nr:hypothetical protein [Pseudomonadota bacterium]
MSRSRNNRPGFRRLTECGMGLTISAIFSPNNNDILVEQLGQQLKATKYGKPFFIGSTSPDD